MSRAIPKDWDVQRLADVANIGSSKRILQSEYVSEGVPFFRSKEVILRSKKQAIRDTLYISRERFEEIKNKFGAPKKNEILITAVGTIGVVYLIEDLEFYFKDGNLLWIKEINKTVSPSYLAKYLGSDTFQSAIDGIAGGSSQAALTIEKLSELEINVPLIDEQHKIASILTAVDEVIESTTAQINKLKDLKTGMMQELLTKGIGHTEFKDSPVGRIPKAWKSGILVDYLSFISYGFTNPMPESDRGPFMITAKDVNDSRIIYESARRTTQKAYDELLSKKSRPELNDILVTKDGTLGRVAVVDRSGVCINQSVAVLRPNEKVLPWFLFYLLSSQKYQREMIDKAGGSTIKHIYITVLDKMEVALPNSIDEQMKIVTVLDSVQRKCDLAENKLRKLIGHKKALMQDLLSGRVRVC